MNRISQILVNLAIGIPLMAGGYFAGAMIDTWGYRYYAAHHGIDCSHLGWSDCLTELHPVYLEMLQHSASFPNFNWHQMIPGFIGIVLIISIVKGWNQK